MSCKLRHCNICWLHRQLIGVSVLALIAYWWGPDVAVQETAVAFAMLAVLLLLVVRHEG